MRKIFLFLLVFAGTSPSALAEDTLCMIRQKNAAGYALAQKLGVPLQGAEILKFEYIAWTKEESHNIGTDRITVRLNDRSGRPLTKIYEVSAKQIRASDNCNIVDVVEIIY